MFHYNNPNFQFYIPERASECTGDVYKHKQLLWELKIN